MHQDVQFARAHVVGEHPARQPGDPCARERGVRNGLKVVQPQPRLHPQRDDLAFRILHLPPALRPAMRVDDAGVLLQLVDGRRAPMRPDVGGRRADAHGLHPQPARRQAGAVGQGAHADAQIVAFLDQVDHAVIE
ncbi:hypothetical protein G6F31_018117 [Rhizopus arrhizus]|nr:hypothetical protein G6F31_018117 [Rhizopus arrhizus]